MFVWSLRFSKGRTAMLLAATAIGGGALWERNKKMAVAAETSVAIMAAASFGLRFDQRQVRVGGRTGRATIGRPSSQRSKSVAKAPADWYLSCGSRSRHFAQIVSRSRSSAGAMERSFGA